MGGARAPSLNPFSIPFSPFFPVVVTVTALMILIIARAEYHDSKETGGIPGLDDDNSAASSSPPVSSTGSSGHVARKSSVPFKPSTKVIIGVLIATFSVIILILLYIKFCSSGNTFVVAANPGGEARLQERNDSGIEREVVELLPIFKFNSLRGRKHGLECAVCLNKFVDPELLRLLPKCKHAFHVECVDTWFDQHSTCPLCRDRINPDEVCQNAEEEASLELDVESGRNNNINNNNNASLSQPENVGERESGLLEIVVNSGTETSSFRRSLDSGDRRNSTEEQQQEQEHRLEHRIIISPSRGAEQRWSNFESCDLLYLTSDMIISEDLSSHQNNTNNVGSRGRRMAVECNRNVVDDDEMENGLGGGGGGGGRTSVGNTRSVSAMTGMRRIFSRGRERGGGGGREEQERQREGLISRWLAWTSKSQPQSQGNVP